MTSLPICDWTSDYYVANQEICKSILETKNNVQTIPSLNFLPTHNFHHGQLVRFQGMIQDMYNPEYFLESYEVKNTQSGEVSIKCGLYNDSDHLQDDEEIILNSKHNKRAERQTYVIVSVPGLNEWVKQRDTHCQIEKPHYTSGVKRILDADEPMDTSEPLKKKRPESSSINEIESQRTVVSKDHILNFPIPTEDGKACHVKIYQQTTAFKLNQVVDVVGFISFDLVIGNLPEMESDAEFQTHNPPSSLVPRIHAIKIEEFSNTSDIPNSPEILSKGETIRSDLHMLLSQILFGDSLAADYLICHLISSIYTRKDYLCLGNFPLNITHFSEKQELFPRLLYDVLKALVPKSHYFQCTLDALNDLSLVPKKDYDCNRLTSGILQLSNNTHFVIDESKLTVGQISANGRLNYETISDLIKFQKLTYDFKFYTIEYETDIPVLILSHLKSFIPCALQIPLKVDQQTESLYPQVQEAVKQYLTDENRLNDIRHYLQLARTTEFQLGDDISDVIQEDFVNLRKADKSVNADNLHSIMVFARLMAISRGKNSLTMDCWKETLAIENERVRRLPCRS